MTAKVAALTMNTQPGPHAAIMSPATAGPSKRAALKFALLSATALTTWSAGTRSETIDCRAGPSTAVKIPRMAAATSTRGPVA